MADLVSLTKVHLPHVHKAQLPHVHKAHRSKTHKIGGVVWGH